MKCEKNFWVYIHIEIYVNKKIKKERIFKINIT